MARRNAYREWLKDDYNELIEALDLGESREQSDLRKHFLRSRWLDQVLWMDDKADSTQRLYYVLRMTTIIGGVIVPALLSLHLGQALTSLVGWVAYGLSLLVAVSAAAEGFFRYGERWRHYRRTVELLKSEGWEFFQLSGPYRRFNSHYEAYRSFAARVESINRLEAEVYITEVAQEKVEDKEETGGEAPSPG